MFYVIWIIWILLLIFISLGTNKIWHHLIKNRNFNFFVFPGIIVHQLSVALLSVLTYGALGAMVHVITVAMGLGSPGLGSIMAISLVGGLVVTAITSVAAYWVTAYTFRKGDDPDNVVIPIITSTMDAVGTALVVMLFMALVF